jgi:hypothetical protein
MKMNKKFDDHKKTASDSNNEIDITTRLRRATDELEERYGRSNKGRSIDLFQPDNFESANCILEEPCAMVQAVMTTPATFVVLPDWFCLIVKD